MGIAEAGVFPGCEYRSDYGITEELTAFRLLSDEHVV